MAVELMSGVVKKVPRQELSAIEWLTHDQRNSTFV
jgi:hypothetical protein